VREFLEFESHPCFHVAYHSADTSDRCLNLDTFGLYSITTDRDEKCSIVIGFCPWCGVSLPTGITPRQ
jgi:hypothetical protein